MSREGSRLISAARFDRWEARIANAIGDALASQEAKALASLRSLSAAAVPTDAFDEASWDTAVDQVVKPAAAGVMAEVLRIVTSVIPEGVTIPTIDLAPHVGALVNKVVGIGAQVAADLTASLTEGAMLGESVSALEDRVRSLFASTEARAHTIARTSVVPAANGATDEAMGVVHTQVVPLEREWLCVAGDTAIAAAAASAVARRWYSGSLVRLRTGAGGVLTVTPQHPVLTWAGWVAAGLLNPGDHLVRYNLAQPVVAGPDVQGPPPIIEQAFDAAVQVRPKLRMVPTVVNLNGDRSDGQVDVVATDRTLRDRLKAPLNQPGSQDLLALSDMTLARLLAERASAAGRIGERDTDSLGCCLLLSGQSLVTVSDPSQPMGLRQRPGCDTGTSHAISDGGAADAESFGDHEYGQPLAVEPNDFVNINMGPTNGNALLLSSASLGDGLRPSEKPSYSAVSVKQHPGRPESPAYGHWAGGKGLSHLSGCLAGLVSPDEILDVERDVAFTGHVYDLSTHSGWFVANGLIIHNSTADNRTREDHAEADGQRVPFDQTFTVGGESLKYPGDPAGSAAQIALCRCTCLFPEAQQPTA